MNTRDLSDKQRIWLEHDEACVAGGGSMKAYADRQGLDLQSFYLWKGRLKKLGFFGVSSGNLSAATAVVPVALRPAPQTAQLTVKAHTRIELANGIIIEAPEHVDVDALCDLLRHAISVA
jgi:hypothetical protein